VIRAWRVAGVTDRIFPRGVASAVAIGFVAATLAFFAALALALALSAGRLAEDWSGGLADVATLHVLAADDVVEAQALAALDVLRTTPGVHAVRIIEVEEQRALLEPWFGSDLALDALPMPLMIEVLADRDRLDRTSLDLRLAADAPGAVFDDHAAWRRPLVASAVLLQRFAFACLGLMALALGAVLSLAATAAIAANGPAIRTLRLIGARDSFIGAAFRRRFTIQTVWGATAGTGLGLILLAQLPATSELGFFLVGIGLAGPEWLAPLAIPPVCGAVAWLATRFAAGRHLRRWS